MCAMHGHHDVPDVMSRSPVNGNQLFRDTYSTHLQGGRNSRFLKNNTDIYISDCMSSSHLNIHCCEKPELHIMVYCSDQIPVQKFTWVWAGRPYLNSIRYTMIIPFLSGLTIINCSVTWFHSLLYSSHAWLISVCLMSVNSGKMKQFQFIKRQCHIKVT